MKKLLALALVALMAGGAMALEYGDVGCGMGMFFSNTEFSDATTNTNPTPAPFNAYIVAIDVQIESIGGYEVGITMDETAIFVLTVTGENGWTNFGTNTNHLAGFSTPMTPSGGAVVLCTMQMLYSAADPQDIVFGPSTPSSWGPENPQGILWDGPAIANASGDLLYTAFLTGGVSDAPSTVATLNGTGITATENHTLSGVKALFD